VELYESVRKFHGKLYAGVIIGVRLGIAARTSYKLKVGEKAKAK
jgi:formylmethanofuran dehydrogenase subunit E